MDALLNCELDCRPKPPSEEDGPGGTRLLLRRFPAGRPENASGMCAARSTGNAALATVVAAAGAGAIEAEERNERDEDSSIAERAARRRREMTTPATAAMRPTATIARGTPTATDALLPVPADASPLNCWESSAPRPLPPVF